MTSTLARPAAFAAGMRIGGAIALAIGGAHFLLPTFGYDQDLLRSIPKVPRDHFVYLGTYAIGIFLVIAGVMSLFFAQVRGGSGAQLFAGAQAAFWAARIVLELIFPSRLQIFFLSDPPIALCAASAVACTGYAVAFLAAAPARSVVAAQRAAAPDRTA
jgi:hypothetical protein